MSPRLPADHYVAKTHALLLQHSVSGQWRVTVASGMGRRLGTCNWTKKHIRLSDRLLSHSSHEQILDTVLHEVAHAIAHERHGLNIKPHGAEWKHYAVLLGARPRASVPPTPEQRELSRALRAARTAQRSRAKRTTGAKPYGATLHATPFFVPSIGRVIAQGDVLVWRGEHFVVEHTKRTRFTARKADGRLYSVPAVLLTKGHVIPSELDSEQSRG